MLSNRGKVSLRVKVFVKCMVDKLESILAAQQDEYSDSDSSDDGIVSVLVWSLSLPSRGEIWIAPALSDSEAHCLSSGRARVSILNVLSYFTIIFERMSDQYPHSGLMLFSNHPSSVLVYFLTVILLVLWQRLARACSFSSFLMTGPKLCTRAIFLRIAVAPQKYASPHLKALAALTLPVELLDFRVHVAWLLVFFFYFQVLRHACVFIVIFCRQFLIAYVSGLTAFENG